MKYLEYFEKKRFGTPEFPVQYFYVTKNHPQYIMPIHRHNEFEIIRVCEGNFNVFLNNVEYNLKKGDILFVEGRCLHSGYPENCVYECIVFDLNMLTKAENSISANYISPILKTSSKISEILYFPGELINTKLNELFDITRKKENFFELKVHSLLLEYFYLMYNSEKVIHAGNTLHSNQVTDIIRLIDWIEKNYAEKINLDNLSRISGFSKKYLCKVFKEYTSKTLINYINELRIENACHEMTIKRKSVTDSAFVSGFNDLSYFCRTFKKYKNMTPREYIKNSGMQK